MTIVNHELSVQMKSQAAAVTPTPLASALPSPFVRKSHAAIAVIFKEVLKTSEFWNEVVQAYAKSGLDGNVISISQSTGSPEINSQNFIVCTDTNQKFVMRRCKKFMGQSRYDEVTKMLGCLKEAGVRVPELYLDLKTTKVIPYFEAGLSDARVGWIYFKFIAAETYFSGSLEVISVAAEQIGKMHACLRKSYGKERVITQVVNPADDVTGVYLTQLQWDKYLEKMKSSGDSHDKAIVAEQKIIEEMIYFVETDCKLLEDPNDVQNIHFNLNSANFLEDKGSSVTIMGFDQVKVGNIYTDIGFAFHRLLTAYIEQGNQDIPAALEAFLKGYQKGNPNFTLNLQKMIVSCYNRALRNVRSSIDLKLSGDTQWLGSIEINLIRLKQVKFLSEMANSTLKMETH